MQKEQGNFNIAQCHAPIDIFIIYLQSQTAEDKWQTILYSNEAALKVPAG